MELAQLIRSAHAYLEPFNYNNYIYHFDLFEKEVEPFFQAEAFPDPDAFFLELEKTRNQYSSKKRKTIQYQDKLVLSLFFSPAASRYGKDAFEFAEQVRQLWNMRYPKESYNPGSFDKIVAGFESNLLGLPLRKTGKIQK